MHEETYQMYLDALEKGYITQEDFDLYMGKGVEGVIPYESPSKFMGGGDYTMGAHVMGPGTGTSDSINAKLSDGEFVMTAEAVKNLGGGDRYAGARKMYNMMNALDPNSARPGEEPQIV